MTSLLLGTVSPPGVSPVTLGPIVARPGTGQNAVIGGTEQIRAPDEPSDQFSSLRSSVSSCKGTLARAEVTVEIGVDFGLFEILIVSGLAALGRAINRRPIARTTVLVASIAAPAALLALVGGESLRWIAALALGTSLINASIIAGSHRERTSRTGVNSAKHVS